MTEQRDNEVHHQLLHLEQQLMDPIFRRDRRAVAELLSEDFREFGSSGRIWTRDSILEMLTSEEAFTTPTVEDFQTQQLSLDTYLVTYRTSRPNQDAPPSAALRSSIWTNRSDKWEILFHQGTRLASPESDQR